MNEILISAISALVPSLVAAFFIYKYKKTLNELKEVISRPRTHSEELSDFLRDQKELGYSFVRVDPASVMIRSPRG
jgi:hypothetical protein